LSTCIQSSSDAVAETLGLVDLAVPRDIEAGVGELPGCHLFDLDDLEHVVAETLHARASVLAEARAIVDTASTAFSTWRRAQQSNPRNHRDAQRC